MSVAVAILLSTFLGVAVETIMQTVEAAEQEGDNEIISKLAQLAGAIEGTQGRTDQLSTDVHNKLSSLQESLAGLSGRASLRGTRTILKAVKEKAAEINTNLAKLRAEKAALDIAATSQAGLAHDASNRRQENRNNISTKQEAINEKLQQEQDKLSQLESKVSDFIR